MSKSTNNKKIKLKMRKAENGASLSQISSNPFSNHLVQFNGPSHEGGGIPIGYNGQVVEVEGNETGFVDKAGDLNIFGNMYVPGTKKKFKAVSKDIAKAEQKAEKKKEYSTKLMNEIPDAENPDPMEQLKANSAMVMFSSATNQQIKATNAKEELADLQNNMLDFANAFNADPKKLWGGKAKDGIKIPLRDTRTKTEYDYQYGQPPSFIRNYEELLNPTVPNQVPTNNLGYNLGEPIKGVQRMPSTMRQVSSALKKGPVTNTVTDNRVADNRVLDFSTTPNVYNEPLGIGQIAPELYTLATNRQEFVPSLRYDPSLLQSYRVSFADRLNQNASTFNAMARMSNNPAALAQLAAQKYGADQAVLGDQFRTNQSIQDQITNRNNELINQSKTVNLQLQGQANQERSQNAAATRSTTRAALTSIASKTLQQKQYNRGLTLYNQMIPQYKFNPDSGAWEFSGGQAPINVNGVPIYSPSASNMYGENRKTSYQRDAKGRVITRDEQRTPGLLKIFKGR